ncbi:MAG: beta-ketoacyl-[acyl-carrier-protein] synthase family protein, partial [Dermatophilaceae bacterium]|nr:beta-ketoacyl-[acyl-carrier-protein] synthase family protein [Dermatophilaceae bacterium]
MTSNRDRRVVVTGLGATTPLGGTAAETWEALLAGRSGARPMDFDWVSKYELPVTFAATIATKPEEVLAKVETRRLDPSSQYALIAAREAWADAGKPEVDPERLGAAIGSGIGGVWTLLDQWDNLREKGPRRVYPLAVPMLMPNGPAAAVSLDLGARAGAHTTVSACASGAESMGYAIDMIRTGRADVVVAGGTEAAVHALPIAGFAAMQALSTRNDEPEKASRPYDTGRDGFVLGEGAAVIVLESEEHARARGARIYAELASVGMSADAHHITAPEPNGSGASRAMLYAVERAGLSPTDIIHINAHATSTPVGDVAEYNAIKRAFGDHTENMSVTATKSMTG